MDHPIVERLRKFNDPKLISSTKKLINHVSGIYKTTFVIMKDPDDPVNPGMYDIEQNIVIVSPICFKSGTAVLYTLIHECGHVSQFRDQTMQELMASFPRVMSNDLIHWNTTPSSARNTYMYWIDYISMENDAWTRGIKIMEECGIKPQMKSFHAFRRRCLIVAHKNLADLISVRSRK